VTGSATDCTFTDNQAALGGGVCLNGGTHIVWRGGSFFHSVADIGAGMYMLLCDQVSIRNTLFSVNGAFEQGGALYAERFQC
jgi:predicted outer membrane repeat protein